jgi:hypothetical protein
MHLCIKARWVRKEVGMTRKQSNRRVSIRSIRRNPPDLSKLGRALIALAMSEAEKEAQAQDADAREASEHEEQDNSEDEA